MCDITTKRFLNVSPGPNPHPGRKGNAFGWLGKFDETLKMMEAVADSKLPPKSFVFDVWSEQSGIKARVRVTAREPRMVREGIIPAES